MHSYTYVEFTEEVFGRLLPDPVMVDTGNELKELLLPVLTVELNKSLVLALEQASA